MAKHIVFATTDREFYIPALPWGNGCTFSIIAVLNNYNMNSMAIKTYGNMKYVYPL